jgi:hypothetical protein
VKKTTIFSLVTIFAAAFLLIGRVPTITDAKASSAIWESFIQQIKENTLMTNKVVETHWSARRGKTILYVKGTLSDVEKNSLKELVDRIGQTNVSRQVTMIFQ